MKLGARRTLEERRRLFVEANKLAEDGVGHKEIGRRLAINRATVYRYVTGKDEPVYDILTPDLSDTPDLAYLSGFYYGDGRSSGNVKNVRFKLADEEHSSYLSGVIAKILQTSRKPVLREAGYYTVTYPNSTLYDFLQLPLERLLDSSKGNVEGFLSGLFDAEGYVGFICGGAGFTGAYVGMANTDTTLIENVRDLLYDRGMAFQFHQTNRKGSLMVVRGKTYVRRHAVYHLTTRTLGSLEKFERIIGFRIPAKHQRLVDSIYLLNINDEGERTLEFDKRYERIGRRWVPKANKSNLSGLKRPN